MSTHSSAGLHERWSTLAARHLRGYKLGGHLGVLLRDERAVTWLSAARSPSTAAATRQPPQLPAWPPHLRQARRGLVDPHDVEQQAPVSRRRGHLEPDLGRRAGELVQRRRQAGARERAEAVLRALPQRARAGYYASPRSTRSACAATLLTSTWQSALIHNGIMGGGHARILGMLSGTHAERAGRRHARAALLVRKRLVASTEWCESPGLPAKPAADIRRQHQRIQVPAVQREQSRDSMLLV